ncbi:MAG TPA: DUF5658 family protein [Gammaproteobacteria bacterium]
MSNCIRVVAVDRRSNSWRTIFGSLVLRRRANPRRTQDGDGAHYVDVHEPLLFFVAVGALLLCVADAFFTLTLLDFHGSYELNPVMDYFIQKDIHQFFFVKFGLTAFGIVFLVLHKNFRLLNRISGYHILYGCLITYATLVAYEVTMLVILPWFF